MHSIKNTLLQCWTMVGLSSMHQALVRRTVESQCDYSQSNSAMQNDASDRPSIRLQLQWQTAKADTEFGMRHWLWPQTLGVSIVDVQLVQRWAESSDTTEAQTGVCPQRANHIRLLWAWGRRHRDSALWCNDWFASGIILDAPSLQAWSARAMRLADKHPDAGHSLLRGLELPTL